MKHQNQYSHQDVSIKEQNIVYQQFFTLSIYQYQFRLYAGDWSQIVKRELLEHPGSVGVLLYDPQLQKVVLVEQIRPGLLKSKRSPWIVEIVAGRIDTDENPAEVAVRESMEEAAATILELVPICRYWPSPGTSSELIHLFCGRINVNENIQFCGLAHEHEDIKVITMDVEDALTNITGAYFENGSTIIALQWLLINKKILDQKWC